MEATRASALPKEVEGCCPDPAALEAAFAMTRPRALVTQVAATTYQVLGEQPRTVADGHTQRWLASDEQPYERKLRIGEEPQALDQGWVGKAGLMVLINDPARFQRVPTEQEKHDAEARVVELGQLTAAGGGYVFHPLILVRPGSRVEIEPAESVFQWHARCRRGEARCILWVLPS